MHAERCASVELGCHPTLRTFFMKVARYAGTAGCWRRWRREAARRWWRRLGVPHGKERSAPQAAKNDLHRIAFGVTTLASLSIRAFSKVVDHGNRLHFAGIGADYVGFDACRLATRTMSALKQRSRRRNIAHGDDRLSHAIRETIMAAIVKFRGLFLT